MRIGRSLPADFCLGRAVRAQASSGRQNSPVRASSDHPADDCNSLIPRMFAALRSARLRFLPCFPLKNRGETDATDVLAPLFARERTCHPQHDADEARLCDERAGKAPHSPASRTVASAARSIGQPATVRGLHDRAAAAYRRTPRATERPPSCALIRRQKMGEWMGNPKRLRDKPLKFRTFLAFNGGGDGIRTHDTDYAV
jgi:hypothetical protein